MEVEYPRPNFERECFVLPDESGNFLLTEQFFKDVVLLNARGTGKIAVNGNETDAGEGVDVTGFVKAGENSISAEGQFDCIWLESAPRIYLKSAVITPVFDEKKVRFEFCLSERAEVTVEIFAHGRLEAAGSTRCGSCELALSDIYPWSPSEPFLYEVLLTAGKDVVKTYFGMRKFSIAHMENRSFIALNGAPYFPIGTTAADVDAAKAAGFDMIKTCKRMPDKWYAECDKKGVIVWQACEAEGTDSFAGVGILTAESAAGADTTRLLDCADGDLRTVNKWDRRKDGRAPVYEYSKKRPEAFFKKSARLMKKGLASAVTDSPGIAVQSAELCARLRADFYSILNNL